MSKMVCVMGSLGLLLGSACFPASSDDGDTEGSGSADGDGDGDGGEDADGSASADGGEADGDDGQDGGGTDGGEVNPGCAPLCEKIVAAGCDNGPTLEGCLLTCKALTSSEACDDKAQTYFDCVGTDDVTCNGAGEPVAPGCALAYLDAIACAVTEDPNPDVVEPCAEYCGHVAAAMCPNNGTEDECNTNCLWSGATGTGCADAWTDFLDCANAAEWSCLLGFAAAGGCGPAYNTYRVCINDAAGG